MRTITGILAAGLVASTMTLPSSATAFFYDEGFGGDIASGTTSFDLDFGANIIVGNISNPDGGLPDFDTFAATVPAGAVLDSIELTLLEGDNGNATFPAEFNVQDGASTSILNADVSAGGDFLFLFGFAVSGLDLVELTSFPAGMDVAYDIKITLSPTAVIPLPAAGALYLGALVFGAMAWRRRRHG